jgi:hypothetical protein
MGSIFPFVFFKTVRVNAEFELFRSEQERDSIDRVLAHEQSIFFLDKPCANHDTEN